MQSTWQWALAQGKLTVNSTPPGVTRTGMTTNISHHKGPQQFLPVPKIQHKPLAEAARSCAIFSNLVTLPHPTGAHFLSILWSTKLFSEPLFISPMPTLPIPTLLGCQVMSAFQLLLESDHPPRGSMRGRWAGDL